METLVWPRSWIRTRCFVTPVLLASWHVDIFEIAARFLAYFERFPLPTWHRPMKHWTSSNLMVFIAVDSVGWMSSYCALLGEHGAIYGRSIEPCGRLPKA